MIEICEIGGCGVFGGNGESKNREGGEQIEDFGC